MRAIPRGGTLQIRDGRIEIEKADRGGAAGYRRHQLSSLRRCQRRSRSDHAPATCRRAAARLRSAAGSARRRAPAPVPSRRHRSGTIPKRRNCPPTSASSIRRRQRPRTRRALLPVRPLSADLQLAPRHPARQPAGHLERPDGPALGKQVHDQHQHRDELLAQRGQCIAECVEPLDGDAVQIWRKRARARRQGDVRSAAAGWCTTTPICGAPPAPSTARNGACGRWAARGSAAHLWDRCDYGRDDAYPAQDLSVAQRRG